MNDHERKLENGRRSTPTKDERIRKAAMRCGPRFTAEDIVAALKGRVTALEVGRRLANADYVKESGRNEVSRAKEWVLVGAESR